MFAVEFLCVVLPLVGAVAGQVFKGCRLLSHIVASSFIGVSCAISWYLFLRFQRGYLVDVLPWFQVGEATIWWSVYIDKLSVVMLVTVATVSLVVHLYSIGYMSGDRGAIRFMTYLSAFTFFMMALVTSGNFLQLFFGWEGVGLCSYLLIGFWFEKDVATASAMKAFVMNRVGDLFFLCGMLGVFYVFRSLNFDEIFEKIAVGGDLGTVDVFGQQVEVLSVACILLFLGCMGKSAQLGLHTWLPDAMEGPTPASALIHAATMVTAGVFLVARSSPLFELSEVARDFVLVIGSATCLFSALVAIVQEDIKKIVAYSTCSQLGYMFVACGVSNYHLAIFHLVTHAFFKSLLFLAAGNVIHSNSGEQGIERMGKNCWRSIPFTYGLMWIGTLSLMGVFPFSGFYSKDLIIEGTHGSIAGFMATNAVVCLTAAYSCRLMFWVFHNSGGSGVHVHESSKIMLLPLVVLAAGAIFSGMWLKNVLCITEGEFWVGSLPVHAHGEVGYFVLLLPSVLTAASMLFYWLYHTGKLRCCSLPDVLLRPILALLRNKFYFDRLYCRFVVRPVSRLSAALWVVLDQKVVDYFVLGGISGAVNTFAGHSVKVQSGRAFDYALVMLFGVVAAALLVVYGVKIQ
ncbi:MAG: NADH-quinone oxidoreductase subunit L [Anaplasma sp.]